MSGPYYQGPRPPIESQRHWETAAQGREAVERLDDLVEKADEETKLAAKREKVATRRFWISLVVSALAVIAGVGSIVATLVAAS